MTAKQAAQKENPEKLSVHPFEAEKPKFIPQIWSAAPAGRMGLVCKAAGAA